MIMEIARGFWCETVFLVLFSVIIIFVFSQPFIVAQSLFGLYLPFALYPSEGEKDEGRAGKAHMEVRVKITTPDLS